MRISRKEDNIKKVNNIIRSDDCVSARLIDKLTGTSKNIYRSLHFDRKVEPVEGLRALRSALADGRSKIQEDGTLQRQAKNDEN